MRLAIVAVQIPGTGEWRFSQLRGMPFGLWSAVNQFNRMAELVTAVARRWLYILTGHAADDNTALDAAVNAASTQGVFQELCELMGIRLSESKSQAAAGMVVFLGHLHDLTRARSDGALIYGPKPGLRESILAEIQMIFAEAKLTSHRAGHPDSVVSTTGSTPACTAEYAAEPSMPLRPASTMRTRRNCTAYLPRA